MAGSSSTGATLPDTPEDARRFFLERIQEGVDDAESKGESVYRVPLGIGASKLWEAVTKAFPKSHLAIPLKFMELKGEICEATGYGCFDGRAGMEVHIQTEDEQKADAEKLIAKFARQGINLAKAGFKGRTAYAGLTSDDKRRLELQYPQAFPKGLPNKVNPSAVETLVQAEEGSKWVIDDPRVFSFKHV